MTNKEAVIAEVQIPNYSENSVLKAMIDLDIDGASDYDPDSAEDIAKAAIKVLKTMLSTTSITEGGFKIDLAVKDRINDLQSEYGLVLTDSKAPTVRSRNVW